MITADPRLLLHSFGGTNEFVLAASFARAFDAVSYTHLTLPTT